MKLFKKKTKKQQAAQARRQRRSHLEAQGEVPLWSKNNIIPAAIFLAYMGLILITCFFGQSPAGPQLLPNQTPKFRIVADFPFSYESKIERERLTEERKQRVAPIYKLDLEPFDAFREKILILNQGMSHLKTQVGPPAESLSEIEAFTDEFNTKYKMDISPNDVKTLLKLNTKTRTRYIEEALAYENEIYRAGISSNKLKTSSLNPSFISIEIKGRDVEGNVQTTEEALLSLRRYLKIMDVDPEVSMALFRILKGGIRQNLIYDAARTEATIKDAANSIDAIIIRVNEGETLIEPGTPITPEQHERLTAYRKALRTHQEYGIGFSALLLERITLTLAILLASLIYIRLGVPEIQSSRKNLILASSMLLINMIFIRLLLQCGDAYLIPLNPMFAALLPYLAPVALAPIPIMVTLGGPPAIIVTLLVSIFTTLMLGRGLEMVALYLLTGLAAIYFSRTIQKRIQLVRAGLLTGFVTALGAAFIGLFDRLDTNTILLQATIAEATGILTGVLAIGIVPLLEHLFKYTTNISLRELTDFNHRLLRQLQMVAPGTYHHSLMVANIAERAARQIGANALMCRACALFHDIGKTVKPEYFVENQKENINPHQEKNPSMSVLVIKSHVSEGAAIAQEARLPKVVIDVIEQHHGTGLIQYFYSKAMQRSGETLLPLGEEFEEEQVEENMFRYDGPKPQFKESAIIMLADSVEAASRSLRKISSQSIQELVENIVHDRIEDGQFDECALTMREISEIKRSLIVSLLNIHHSRVEYPSLEKEKKNDKQSGEQEVQADN